MEVVGKQCNYLVFNSNPKSSSRFTIRLVQASFHAIIFFAAMFCGSSALAIGFAEMRVQSALGQPLRVQIGLLGSDSNDADSRCFKAKVMSLDDVLLSAANIKVNNDGPATVIVLSTKQTINEPAVTLGVEYNCASRTQREYQILLDLPAIAPPVVDAHLPVAALALSDKHPVEAAPQFPLGTTAADNGIAPRKARRPRTASEFSVTDKHTQPQLAMANEVKEKHTKKSPSMALRNVLRIGRDDSVDDRLNGVEGMHLALSHSLFGSRIMVDGKLAEPAQARPAGGETPTHAVVASSDASVPAADPGLQELQAKIRVLEAETEELRKLNAKHLTALEATQKNQNSNGPLPYLYFLLFGCVAAIAWLMWRTKQIQSEITHSLWHQIVPQHGPLNERDKQYTEVNEDALQECDEPLRDIENVVAPGQARSAAMMDEPPAGALLNQQLQENIAETASAESKQNDNKLLTNGRSGLPNAEEILDEIQQAEFWMDMHQPQRAIEILESNCSVERPSSPLPWLYLFDLYRLVGSREKYEDLTEHFERIFNGRVIPWDDADASEHSRNLEEFPFLMKKIIQLWGTDELVPFMESLLIDDRDGRRQGFDLGAYRDILFLTNIAYEIQVSKSLVRPPFTYPEWSIIE